MDTSPSHDADVDSILNSISDSEDSPAVETEETPTEEVGEPADETEEADSPEEEAPEESEEDLYEFQADGKVAQFNLNDKERIKKILPMAYGFREAQARANRAESKLSKIEPEFKEKSEKLDRLNKLWDERGEEGIIDLLGGKEGYYKEWLAAKVERQRAFEDASPSEQEYLLSQERAEKLQKELERERRLREEESSRLQVEREEADTKSLENQLHPAFNKYRFRGKLGDEDTEAFYDKALWRETLDSLEALPEDEMTETRIAQEFKRNYERAARVIQKKSEEKAKKVVEAKKKQARTGAQIAAKKGVRPNTQKEKQEQDMAEGRWTDAILRAIGGGR